MNKKKTKKQLDTKNLMHYGLLTLIVVGAFFLRVVGSLDKVFVGDNVWFRGMDAWYHMRLADVVNFPAWFKWDYFAQYPEGALNGYMPLLAWLSVNDTVAAYIPPVFGALTLILVYLIGRQVFDRKTGLLATLLTAVLPGEFLYRTLLGFTDHHCLETFFMMTSVYFLLRLRKEWRRTWVIPLSISLGLYTISWAGVAFFLMILGIWMWWECLLRIKQKESFLPMIRTLCVSISIAGLIGVAYAEDVTIYLLLTLILLPLSMGLLSWLFKDTEKVLFGLTIVVPVALVIIGSFINYADYIIPIFWGGAIAYIEEAGPLTPSVMFATYGLSFFLAPAGLWFFRKTNSLFTIWAIILIIVAIGQLRWGYYTTIPVSILTAAFTFKIATWMQKAVRPAIIGIIIVFLLLPNIQNTILVSRAPNQIDANWYVTLTWLRDNTPEASHDALTYYNLGLHIPQEDRKLKPRYTILSWWDYGHWIIRIAHRVPLTSPTQSGGIPSEFFTARNEEEANLWLKGLNVPYAIIDKTLIDYKWPAILQRAEEESYTNLHESFLWTLWNEQASTWVKIYERGDIKVFERLED